MRFNATLIAITSFAVISLLVSCQKSDVAMIKPAQPADPHDVPITEADVRMPANYAEAVSRIKSYRDAIRDAADSETPSVAHLSLDELDIVLRKLPEIARNSGVPLENLKTVNLSARELREWFNKVHAAIDEKRKPDFPAVADKIQQAIDRLGSVIPKEGS
jgi:hypothetical protein